MARFRQRKDELRALLAQEDPAALFAALDALPPMEAVSPLLSFLLDGGTAKWRAVAGLGLVVGRLADEDPEKARIIMRRLIWQLNEDSGNMGWGIAESMGEILAQNQRLATEYGRILLSYARPTGKKADNYIEHGPLRRGVYWAIGRFAAMHAPLRLLAVTLLAEGLRDEDKPARGVAAWGLGRIAESETLFGPEWEGVLDALRAVVPLDAPCEVMQGGEPREERAGQFAEEALETLRARFPGGCF